MAGKDPAFLFFTLDWLQLTAKLYPEEKGVFIDLLCHQHREGAITNDPVRLARTVGLTVDQFQPIWSTVRLLFEEREGNLLVNLWLEEKTTNRSTDRSTNSHVRSILSRFAVLVRKAKGAPVEIIEQIKKEFNVVDYQQFNIEEAAVRLTKWWTYRYDQLVELGIPIGQPKNNLVIENENENIRLEEGIGGMGEKEGGREGPAVGKPPLEGPPWPEHASELPQRMMEIYVAEFSGYPQQQEKDFAACLQIAYQLAELSGWPWQSALNGRMPDILDQWRQIVQWIKTSSWFRTKSITFLNDKFQDLIQAKNHGTNTIPTAGGEKQGTSVAVTEALKKW